DPRTQFMNWALLANAAWDYPSDSLGYTTGIMAELNQPKWALRYGFFQLPRYKNSWTVEDQYLTLPRFDGNGDGAFFGFWGMAAEVERRYSVASHAGAIRLLAFINEARMGAYSAALAFPGTNIAATRAYHYKYGFGLNWQQEVAEQIGLFSRIGWNDGHYEGWMFNDIDHTASLGVSVGGARWNRDDDTIGLAGVLSGISRANQRYLDAGGTDILDGDGRLDYGFEKVIETYYDCAVVKQVHLALDYQFVGDPAFNQARGPVNVFALRLHVAF
ncbi:MAG TPA: carbohydrate porin, partial [Candidatus Binataceae bacterium]|nr:carbohydrate porin [Candidatus Binataceae bacterium]